MLVITENIMKRPV